MVSLHGAGSHIALVRSIDNYDNNLQNAIQWALDNSLGNQISNSYGSDEYDNDAAGMQSWDDLNAEGAALGVSINFSTGDDGDFYRAVGAYTVSVPSDSPHATAVGGTSDFINPDYTMKFQTGWGTDLTRIAAPAAPMHPRSRWSVHPPSHRASASTSAAAADRALTSPSHHGRDPVGHRTPAA